MQCKLQWRFQEYNLMFYIINIIVNEYTAIYIAHKRFNWIHTQHWMQCEGVTLTGEPVLVSIPLHYAGFLCKVVVSHAWNLRQFLQELHNYISSHHNLHNLFYTTIAFQPNIKNWCKLYLKLLVKPSAPSLWVLFLHVWGDQFQIVGHHSSIAAAEVVIEGIMDEGILLLV